MKIATLARGALGVATPYALLFALRMAVNGGIVWGVVWLGAVAAVWVVARPGRLLLTLTAFGTAAFFFLAPFGLDAEPPASVTRAEAELLVAAFPRVAAISAALGTLLALFARDKRE